MSLRLRRSELSTPGSSEKMMIKAAASDADLVFLDLEDSVAPAEKPQARNLIVEALRGLDWGKKTRAVRVNAAETVYAYEDVITVVEGAGEYIDLLILPKIKAPRDIWFFGGDSGSSASMPPAALAACATASSWAASARPTSSSTARFSPTWPSAMKKGSTSS